MATIGLQNYRDLLSSRQDVGRPAQERTTAKSKLVYLMWILVLFEPDWFLSAHGAAGIERIFTLLLIPVAAMIAFCGRREAFYWPYLLIITIHAIWLPFALNSGFVMTGLKQLFQYFLIFALTVSILDTPRKTVLLVKLALLQFIWYGIQGIPSGKVWWHFILSNEDSYGPLMVLGLGFSFYFATGTNSKVFRHLSSFTCFLCMAGAILSFARGAMLALCVVLLAIWIRTPQKTAFLGYGLVAIIVGLAVIQIAFPAGEFWAEMETIGEVNTEGTKENRFIFWKVAWELFLLNPILGVGPGNFGPNAFEYYQGPLGGMFSNPAMLYNAFLHNDYIQILVEQGLLGFFLMGVMLVRFNNRLRFLRTESARTRWQDDTSGFIDLRNLSLGLEVAMIGYLANAVFYGHLYFHWFWSMFALAYVLANVTREPAISTGARPLANSQGKPRGFVGGAGSKFRVRA